MRQMLFMFAFVYCIYTRQTARIQMNVKNVRFWFCSKIVRLDDGQGLKKHFVVAVFVHWPLLGRFCVTENICCSLMLLVILFMVVICTFLRVHLKRVNWKIFKYSSTSSYVNLQSIQSLFYFFIHFRISTITSPYTHPKESIFSTNMEALSKIAVPLK